MNIASNVVFYCLSGTNFSGLALVGVKSIIAASCAGWCGGVNGKRLLNIHKVACIKLFSVITVTKKQHVW